MAALAASLALSSSYHSVCALKAGCSQTGGQKREPGCVRCGQQEANYTGEEMSRRQAVGAVVVGGLGWWWSPSALGLLENDDDDALLEKVKEDKKKRIQKRGAISSLQKETESLQVAVYNLSKAGQAIDGADFNTASSVLGTSLDTNWIVDVKAAFSKVSTNPEEQGEADSFKTALASLQSAVVKHDADSSRSSFVASASALEKWTTLTGLSGQIKGL